MENITQYKNDNNIHYALVFVGYLMLWGSFSQALSSARKHKLISYLATVKVITINNYNFAAAFVWLFLL